MLVLLGLELRASTLAQGRQGLRITGLRGLLGCEGRAIRGLEHTTLLWRTCHPTNSHPQEPSSAILRALELLIVFGNWAFPKLGNPTIWGSTFEVPHCPGSLGLGASGVQQPGKTSRIDTSFAQATDHALGVPSVYLLGHGDGDVPTFEFYCKSLSGLALVVLKKGWYMHCNADRSCRAE